MKSRKNKVVIWSANIVFLFFCAVILAFLIRAPDKSTAALPHDENHQELFMIDDKKKAEQYCSACHAPGETAPLPVDHPPKFRCLFCHQRNS